MTHPAYTREEAQTRQTFLALMWSLSYPGKPHTLPASGLAAFYAIADALLDLETSYFSPHDELAAYLARSGARALPPDLAAYHFYPEIHDTLLPVIASASIGTLIAPDQGATLALGCKLGVGLPFGISGPGVPLASPPHIQIDAVSPAFWELRTRANRYPRGWDIFLVDGDQVIGLPRTTHVAPLSGTAVEELEARAWPM